MKWIISYESQSLSLSIFAFDFCNCNEMKWIRESRKARKAPGNYPRLVQCLNLLFTGYFSVQDLVRALDLLENLFRRVQSIFSYQLRLSNCFWYIGIRRSQRFPWNLGILHGLMAYPYWNIMCSDQHSRPLSPFSRSPSLPRREFATVNNRWSRSWDYDTHSPLLLPLLCLPPPMLSLSHPLWFTWNRMNSPLSFCEIRWDFPSIHPIEISDLLTLLVFTSIRKSSMIRRSY